MDFNQRERVKRLLPGAIRALQQSPLIEDVKYDSTRGVVTIEVDPVHVGPGVARAAAEDIAAGVIDRAKGAKE